MAVIARFKARVEQVEKEAIPKLYRTLAKSLRGGYEAEFDAHEDLVVYSPSDEIEVTLSTTLPSYREGVDFLGVGYVASKRQLDGGGEEVLISIGGLVFKLKSLKRQLNLNPMDKVYVKISRTSEEARG
ncbi:MAG: DNA-directed RNA polymerase subunit G [Thermoproteota archaeon]